MNEYVRVINPSVRAIQAYHLKDRSCQIKLNQNESPFDLPEWLKEEIWAEFKTRPWNRYPSYTNSGMSQELAQFFNITVDRLLIGNGSNELLQIVFATVLEPGKRVLLVTPTFLIYPQLARINGAEILEIEFAQDWSFPVEEIVGTLQGKMIELCVLCAPNSPTGVGLAESDLQRILQSSKGLVLVDEAYFEFSNANYLQLQSQHKNLIVTRTLSKAMGLAGLRMGYLIADRDLIRELNKAKLPYNVNVFSEFVVTRLLKHPEVFDSNIERILQERDRLARALNDFEQITVYSSKTNFIMIETPYEADVVFEKLLKQGILIRDISKYHPRLARKLRITVGTPEENNLLLAALHTIFPQ